MFKQLGYWQLMLFGWLATTLLFPVVSPAAEKWQIVSELPTQRTGFATAVVDGKVYLIGGTPFQNRRGPYGLSCRHSERETACALGSIEGRTSKLIPPV